jgi:hypothetical protein
LEKNANFFAEHWRKSQKIVIVTLTPVCLPLTGAGRAGAAASAIFECNNREEGEH